MAPSERHVRAATCGHLLAAVLLCAVAGRPAHAQEAPRPERPYRGLFGGGGADHPQQLDLTWSMTGAYDDNVAADAPSAIDPRFQVKGTYGTAAAGLAYSAHSQHASFSATAASDGRYYPDQKAFSAFDGSGGVNMSADLGAKTRIQAFQGFSYLPYYELNFLSALVPATSASSLVLTGDHALTTRESYGYVGNFAITEQVGVRSDVTVDYAYRHTRFTGDSERFTWQTVGARFSHHVTRYASLRVGYGYGEGSNGAVGTTVPIASHSVDLGVDYSRPLSFSRRTTVAFSSGSTIVPQNGVSYYRLVADASLNREIGRSWNANVGYNRGVEFEEGFPQPIYADSLRLRVGGLVSRRTQFSVSSGYSIGQLGVSAADPGFSTYSGSSELRVALTRTLSFYTQYFYYRYTFDATAQLPFNLPRGLNRQGVRFGLSGWLPLLH